MNERAFGTNDVENGFSELVLVAGGYMPRLQKALESFRKAERRAQSKMDGNIAQYTSRKKRYPVHLVMARRDWLDVQRLPKWWKEGTVGRVSRPAVAAANSTTHTSGTQAHRKRGSSSLSNRQFAQAVANKNQKLGGASS